MSLKCVLAALVALMVIRGCSSKQKKQSSAPTSKAAPVQKTLPDFSGINTENVYAYSCGDSLQFSAHVTKDSTWLFLPDTSLKVEAVPAGSGAKYEGSSYIYWSKGDEAILQAPTGSFMTCKTIPKEKSWAAARIRGVDFRALGQEPGWQLEITRGKQITYIGNYGQDTLVTPVPEPKTSDREGRIVYKAKAGNRRLTVAISDTSCTDSMSGFHFPASVTVTVDGKNYHGCGRALN